MMTRFILPMIPVYMALAILIGVCLTGCTNPQQAVGAVNSGISAANAACQAAQSQLKGGADKTASTICKPVAQAASNVGMIDSIVAYADAFYESIFGVNQPVTQ